jgi:hypothetical protein
VECNNYYTQTKTTVQYDDTVYGGNNIIEKSTTTLLCIMYSTTKDNIERRYHTHARTSSLLLPNNMMCIM